MWLWKTNVTDNYIVNNLSSFQAIPITQAKLREQLFPKQKFSWGGGLIKHTRMHSSRMCTARLLTISHSIPCISGGVYPPPPPVGWPWVGVGQTPNLDADPPFMWPVMRAGKPTPLWTEWHTHVKNITLPETSLAGGIKELIWLS